MAMVLVMLRQIAMMALLMMLGVVLSRKGFLSEQGAKDLGTILVRIVIPCVIIKAFLKERTPESLRQLGLSFLLAFLALAAAMAVAWLVFGERRRIENFSAAFCNSGFIGIPLIQAAIGEEGVFYISTVIVLVNFFQWTYGLWVMTGDRSVVSAKKIVANPATAATLAGLLLFLTALPVPAVAVNTLSSITAINTPVAMILMGTYMAKMPLRQLVADRRAYLCVLVRLLVIPVVTLILFMLVPARDSIVKLAVFIAVATPVGANVSIFAQLYDCDYELSVVTVCLSTLLSVATVPLLVSVAQALL